LTVLHTPSLTAQFEYDPLGRRTRYTKGSTLKTYFLNGLDVLSDGTAKFLHGAGIDQPLQVDSGTLSASYLQDRLGSTSQLVDSANGSVKTRYDYKSYGKLEGHLANPQPANPFTYTAREDDGTGLMYYRARYYDPELEAFVSQDPLGQAQRYVGGNPLGAVDPLGLKYVDFNITVGFWGGFTFGVFGDVKKPEDVFNWNTPYYPYLGGGFVTPGASASLNTSKQSISPGCWSIQGAAEIGPLFGAVGYSPIFNGKDFDKKNIFKELGAGWGLPVPAGFSGTVYYTSPKTIQQYLNGKAFK
jgi:RHS repeat-associated protein